MLFGDQFRGQIPRGGNSSISSGKMCGKREESK